MIEYCNPDELQHWGIKGMRWGIRRFQNKDGSLTAAGRKRRRNIEDRDAGKSKVGNSKGGDPKKISEMTDDEIRARINRLQLEKNLKDLEKQVSSPNSQPAKQNSKGKNFVKSLMNDVVGPSLRDAGKQQLTKLLNQKISKALGIDEKDTGVVSKELQKTAKELQLKKQINEVQKYFKEESEKQAIKNKEEAQRQVDEYNAKREREAQSQYSTYRQRYPRNDTNTSTFTEPRHLTGYVPSSDNTPFSSFRNNSGTKLAINNGESYVADILDSKGDSIGTTTYSDIENRRRD